MRHRLAILVVVAGLLASACGSRVEVPTRDAAGVAAPPPTPPTTSVAPTPSPPPRPVTLAERGEIARLAAEPERRTLPDIATPGWSAFAAVGGVELVHPADRIARIGFHESNHDGARQLRPLPTAANALTLQTRDRGTGSRTAADVVVHPEGEIRAPVTGTVLRAGTYVLYCEHSDDYAVIEPDGHPGWEVKVLHIDGVQVQAGDRVEAGTSLLALRPTPLPFRSQVDDHTAEPSWPHVHIEVVDPSIPDRPSPGGGC